jgi:hypothetical protein
MTTTDTIGLCFQNNFAGPNALPPGWDNTSVSISGGYLRWGSSEADETLDATREQVMHPMRGHLGRLRGDAVSRENPLLILDLEGNVRLNGLGKFPLDYRRRVAEAVALRLSCAREFFGHSVQIGLYIGGWALNGYSFGNAIDFANSAALCDLAMLGAFDELDVLWQRCYAMRQPGEAGWQKQESLQRNGLTACRAAAAASGRAIPVIAGLSWECFGGSGGIVSADGLRQQIVWSKGFDRIEVWAPGHDGSAVTVAQGIEYARGVGLMGSGG